MASIPPPQGLTDTDYEAIEAAVTETVRGRWFLSEYARRNRLAETRQLLDAMARLESAVLSGPTSLPSADPSIRLLIQRIKEISTQLGGVASQLRAAGIDERLVETVDTQARAVAGMMRSASGPASRSEPTRIAQRSQAPRPEPQSLPPDPTPTKPHLLHAEAPVTPTSSTAGLPPRGREGDDPRLAPLAELDALPLERKLALFS